MCIGQIGEQYILFVMCTLFYVVDVLLLLSVRYLYLIWKLKHEAYDRKRLIYHNHTSLQHLLWNLNMVYFTYNKLNDMFNIYICGFAYMNNFGNLLFCIAIVCICLSCCNINKKFSLNRFSGAHNFQIVLSFVCIIIIIIKSQFTRRSNMVRVTTWVPYNVRCLYSGNSQKSRNVRKDASWACFWTLIM